MQWKRHLPEPVIFWNVLVGLLPVVGWAVFMSVLVGLYATLLQERRGWPVVVSSQYINFFALASFALSLLLVFRTNSSYGRWWEGRIALGAMLNHMRNISRQVTSWVPEEEQAVAERIVHWTASLMGLTAGNSC